jgi:hypothetical protein
LRVFVEYAEDSSLHFFGAFLSFGEWHSNTFFQYFLWLETRDPLSPMLFVLVMEILSIMSSAAVSGGLLFGVSVGNVGGIEFSYLLFVGDTLTFYGANVDNVVGLASILDCGVSFLPVKYLDLPLGSLTRLNIYVTVLLRR